MPLNAVVPLSAAFRTPVVDGVAVLSVVDVYFGNDTTQDPKWSTNLPCAFYSPDFALSYPLQCSKSDDVTTFMQVCTYSTLQ